MFITNHEISRHTGWKTLDYSLQPMLNIFDEAISSVAKKAHVFLTR